MLTLATHWRRWAAAGVFVGLVLTAAVGCIISGDPCGPHQVQIIDVHVICVCEPNAVIDADMRGCTPCGKDEVVLDNMCACKPGFIKPGPGEACAETSIGASCTSAADCQTDFPYCVGAADGAGYCTSTDCASNADCPSNWSCETDGDTSYCHKPPSGLGESCQSSSDCASFEASFCETLQSHTCVVGNCAKSASICPNEWGCCDYSALLGAPLSVCVTPDKLVGGMCASGGTLVKP